ncbi:MAG: SRPBCC domain-containing protein [Chloroflexi bacterium]|nr:SRPBCC domain-containing protein [Chloroflexota bacterium]
MASVDLVITKEIRIEAPRETVFPFLTEPELMIRWAGTEADLDPTPGGVFRVKMTAEATAIGEYVEVTPHSRVVFTWGWDGAPADGVPPGSSRVEVDLEADGDATILTLTHTGLPEAAVGEHSGGWDYFLGRLVVAGAGGDAGPITIGG